MPQALDTLKETPSQTAGPYVHIGLMPNFVGIHGAHAEDLGGRMLNDKAKGQRIAIEGHVFDGTGEPLRDCVIEIWQADAAGLYPSPSETRGTADPNFAGWGRAAADPQSGLYRFETIKPGRVPFPDGRLQGPHVSLWIVARGINLGLNTRMYFSDEAEANAADPILLRIEHRTRVPTLIGTRTGDSYRFDIHLQGPDETVFFDI
ncbi:MAG: protocatechuate 3,4-dioxygenase subunit alpha [Devosia sp. 67-54]|uniref:protocatechuate 3,4-dioxygenase subunit alpha n=1 Tax=unclassified Devosia TaxID=196773 RepID=UPI000868D7ED|nr:MULTISPECIES: protocatechuate 3,4-dioxygenase subunit alpha [unclassified Devosia]MBN9306568.1 protocatechuate 3,4-dioxygenase subunit alpha [Devosia sp.]ODU62615.1 MAG: protocatechuate 3,4-dioxygenase subunit alpha [Acetobacteraceae bacterium SCN 69-10]OJX15853.1 MAG: protocatechuate 3,4-dioxygenase subunit alpha [Devosia sp. 67-54]